MTQFVETMVALREVSVKCCRGAKHAFLPADRDSSNRAFVTALAVC